MAGYLGNIPVPQATMTHDTFVATSGQTSFATSGYTPNFLQVFLNGVKLVNGDDFTATNGSDVVLTSGATAGDTVEVLSYSTYEVNAQTYTGGLTVNNDAATVLTVDRATSDGALIDLQRDGTSVGIVGSAGTGIYIGQTDTMLTFFDDNDTIYPSTNGVATRDAAVILGASNARFKDLYLSGGVYLGGTGAANLLDDYEEGTWTPTLEYTSNGTSTKTYSTRVGSYTKVGNLVTVSAQIRLTAFSKGTASGDVQITGLPFTAGVAAGDEAFFGSLGLYDTPFLNIPVCFVLGNSAIIRFQQIVGGGTWTAMSDPDANSQYFVTVTYRTT